MDDFIDLFIKTSRHFAEVSKDDDKIRSFSDEILPEINERLVYQHQFSSDEFFRMILLQIGSWLLIEESFAMETNCSPWMTSYCKEFPGERKQVFVGDISLRKLLSFAGDLIPVAGSPPPTDTEISRQDLNAYTLTQAGRICLKWTTNIAEHLTLKRGDRETSLMLFGMPCTLSHPNSRIALRY
jgi:hypothetical protein